MNRSVIQQLIRKDFRLHRLHILLSVVGGVLSLALLQVKSEAAFIAGCTWYFVSLIVLGSLLPVSNVINERKKQNLAFAMSLPVSAIQYTTSKLVSTVAMFLVPWLTLVAAGLSVIIGRSDLPDGIIPALLVLSATTFTGFCVIAGTAIVSESEGWTVAATIVCNSSYGLAWYAMIRDPAIRHDLGSPFPVWSPFMLTTLAIEIATIVLILGITFYLQSRKRDFI
jgi:ABC-2 type transport system permease protein